MSQHDFEITEEQRQLILLAIAELALSRPGWDHALGEIAEVLHGVEMFAGFKETNADRVHAQRDPVNGKSVTDRAEYVYQIRDRVFTDPQTVHHAILLLGNALKRQANQLPLGEAPAKGEEIKSDG